MSWITDRLEQEKKLPPRVPPTPEQFCDGMVNTCKELFEHMAGPSAVKISTVRNYINTLWPAVVERYPDLSVENFVYGTDSVRYERRWWAKRLSVESSENIFGTPLRWLFFRRGGAKVSK